MAVALFNDKYFVGEFLNNFNDLDDLVESGLELDDLVESGLELDDLVESGLELDDLTGSGLELDDLIDSGLSLDSLKSIFLDYLFKNIVKDYFPDYQGYKIQYFYTDNLHIKISVEKSLSIEFSDSLTKLLKKSRKERRAYSSKHKSEKFLEDIEAEHTEKFYNVKKEFFKKLALLPVIFIPATRSFVSDFDGMRLRHLNRPSMGRYSNFPVGNQSLRMFSDTYGRYLTGFEKLDKNHVTLIKGNVHKETVNRIIFSVNGQKLDISQVSSGQKELFPILLILQEIVARKDPNLIIIEEPEAHLFPKDQRAIFDTIISAINKSGSKVFITTHSPYMLMSANNLIEAQNKNYKPLKDKFIKHDAINVHKLSKGSSESLMDKEDNLINGEYLESIIDEIYQEYDQIIDEE